MNDTPSTSIIVFFNTSFYFHNIINIRNVVHFKKVNAMRKEGRKLITIKNSDDTARQESNKCIHQNQKE